MLRTAARLVQGARDGVLTLDEARRRARKFLVSVLDGDDPRDGRPATDTTVSQFGAIYVDDFSRQVKRTWYDDERRFRKYVVPALGTRLLVDVERSDVARIHQSISRSAPVEANRVLALTRLVFAGYP